MMDGLGKRKKNKQLMAFVLCLVFMISAGWHFPVKAEPVSETVDLIVSSAECAPGETVTLDVGLQHNTKGVGVMILAFEYDTDALQLTKIEGMEISEGGHWEINKNAVWDDTQNTFFEGPILQLSFLVSEQAPCGDMNVTVKSAEMYTVYEESIGAVISPGSIRVHQWGEWIVTREPTGENPGEETRTCAHCGETQTREIPKLVGPTFKTQSLLLSGQIGVNFYLDLPQIEGVDYEDSYMEFTVEGETKTDPFDPDCLNRTGQYYGFTCYVNVAQMEAPITAVFHYGDGRTVSSAYSVVDYIESFDTNADSYDEKTVELIHSIADYGYHMQQYLSREKNWTIGVEHAEQTKHYTDTYAIDAVRAAVADAAITLDIGESDIERVTYSLYLDAETSIYLYVKVNDGYDGAVTATVDGVQAAAERQSDGRYRIAIGNIEAHQLKKTYGVNITTASGTATVRVSAMSYVHGALRPEDVPSHIQNGMAALYTYADAAIRYKV